MKKNTDKQPIDDLFARKLSKMWLAPSSDGFQRLQKRMNRDKPEVRMVFWRNQTFQRYMTAAACLGLVCLFGWLYWHSSAQTASENAYMATNHPLPKQPKKSIEDQSSQVNVTTSNEQKNDRQLALAEETAVNRKKRSSTFQFDNPQKPELQIQSASTIRSESALTQVKPVKSEIDLEDTRVQHTPQADHVATEQGASNTVATVKPNPVAERVLIVTIEEPASLVVARQKARDFIEEKAALAVDDNDKAEKDVKRGVWQQVKRFKEGEMFARHSEGNTDEQGLLDRAYNGLKHGFDKNKPTKQ